MAQGQSGRWLERTALAVVLLIAATLRLWRLEENGFGTAYYAAGVRSMLQGGWLFFYDAFDPAGFISLDKPPVAFWIQTAFAGALGYDGWTLHLPQALASIASVALLYRLVRWPFGVPAGACAALILAVAPIAVAVDRSNNTGSWLVFFLLLAAAAALRGRGLSLVVSMALLGLAFNVERLAAFVCGPALLTGWLLASPLDWRRRLKWIAASGVTLLVVSLAWAVAFDLTPADSRPYAGGSRTNSMLELVVGPGGLERFVHSPLTAAPTLAVEAHDSASVGPLRLAHPNLAAQFAWTLPLAVLGAVLGWRRRRASVALWSVWTFAYVIVLSGADGIFHAYHLSALAPPIAALAGIGCFELWRRGSNHLALGLAVTALWQGYIAVAALGWDTAWIGFPLLALAVSLAVLWRAKRPPAVIGGIALLVLPTAWALSALFAPGDLAVPSASLARWLGRDDGRGLLLSRTDRALTDDPRLLAFLEEHRGQTRFLLAAPNVLLAAPVIVRTGQPVMAFGGFLGNDPVMSVGDFARKVEQGAVRFVVLSSNRRMSDFERWVHAHGKPVDPELWRSLPSEPRRSIALYDLAAH